MKLSQLLYEERQPLSVFTVCWLEEDKILYDYGTTHAQPGIYLHEEFIVSVDVTATRSHGEVKKFLSEHSNLEWERRHLNTLAEIGQALEDGEWERIS